MDIFFICAHLLVMTNQEWIFFRLTNLDLPNVSVITLSDVDDTIEQYLRQC